MNFPTIFIFDHFVKLWNYNKRLYSFIVISRNLHFFSSVCRIYRAKQKEFELQGGIIYDEVDDNDQQQQYYSHDNKGNKISCKVLNFGLTVKFSYLTGIDNGTNNHYYIYVTFTIFGYKNLLISRAKTVDFGGMNLIRKTFSH